MLIKGSDGVKEFIRLDDRKDVVIAANGDQYNITATDPFGFWEVSRPKGMVPKALSHLYTSRRLAYMDVRKYLDSIFAPSERPVLKTKKVA